MKFVIRLKENWKPKVTAVARGQVARMFFAGTDLDVLLDDETLPLKGKPLDATVHIGTGSETLELRLVGVPTPKKGYCFFLTNLPPSISAIEVGNIYRVRWEVELSFKLDKESYRLDQEKGERACSLKALLHASLIASVLTGVLVHQRVLETRPARSGQPRTQPPLHHGLVARCLIQWADRIARTFEFKGEAARAEWDGIAARLQHAGADPSWRSKPSVLDKIRGWGGRGPKRARRSRPTAGRRSAK